MAVPVITNNSPAPGSISWDAFTIQYQGVPYSISAGSTSSRWVWWRYNGGSSIIEAGADVPQAPANQLLNSNFATVDPVDATLPQYWSRGTTGQLWFNAVHTTSRNATTGELELKTGVAGAANGPTASQLITLIPGSTIRVTFDIKATGATQGVYAMITNTAGTAEIVRITGLNALTGMTTTYKTYTGSVVIPAGAATSGRLMILSYQQALNAVVSLRNISYGLDAGGVPLGDDDLLLFGNKNGIGLRVQSTSYVDGELLVDGSVFADAVAANQINSGHITTVGLDAGVVKFGTMSGSRIDVNTIAGDKMIANSIDVTKMIMSDFTNYIADGDLAAPTLANWGTGLTKTDPVGEPPYIEWANAAGGNSHRYNMNYFEINPGDQFYFSCEVSTPATNTMSFNATAAIESYNADGATTGWPQLLPVAMAPNTPWTPMVGVITIPAGAYFRGRFNPIAFASTTGGQLLRMRRMSLRKMANAELIVDGSILARHIVGDTITSNEIATGAITANELAVKAVTADKIEAKAVSADKLAALLGLLGTLVVTDGSGRTISLSPDEGINVVDQAGKPVFSVPTKLDSDISMTADVVARSLTATGVVALRNAINELAPGATMYMRKGTTPPRSPLIVTNDWTSTYVTAMYFYGYRTLMVNDTLYVMKSSAEPGGSGTAVIAGKTEYYIDLWTYNQMTRVETFVKRILPRPYSQSMVQKIVRMNSSASPAAGVPVYAGLGAYIVPPATTGIQTYCIHLWDKDWNYLRTIKLPNMATFAAQAETEWPAIVRWNDTWLGMIFADTAGKVRCVNFPATGAADTTPAGTAQWTSDLDLGTPGTGNPQVLGAVFNTFDYGDGQNRFLVMATTSTNNTPAVFVLNNAGVRQTASEFPIATGAGSSTNILHDEVTNLIYTVDDVGNLKQYTDNNYPVAADATQWFSAEWVDANGKTTTEGPVTKFTQARRAALKITSPALPVGIPTWRLFAGKGATDPGRTGRFLQGDYTSDTVRMSDILLTGANPALVADIPDSAPSRWLSDGQDAAGAAVIDFSGTGAGRVGPNAWDKDGVGLPQPYASRRNGANLNIPTSVWTTITYGTAHLQSGGSGITFTTGGTFTIVKPGLYLVSSVTEWDALNTTGRRIVRVNFSGVEVKRKEQNPVAGVDISMDLDMILRCVAGDTIKVEAWQNSGATVPLTGTQEYMTNVQIARIAD